MNKRNWSQNNLLENNVKWVPAKFSTLFSSGLFWPEAAQIWRELFHIIFRRIVLEAAQIWWEPQQKIPTQPHNCTSSDLAGTCSTIFSGGFFWDWFLLDLRSFFGAQFRYKLMYYYFYHRSDLREIIRFLREIECIEFECNEFVLVLFNNWSNLFWTSNYY